MKVFCVRNVVKRTSRTQQKWWFLFLIILIFIVGDVMSLNGSHVCTVQQKYNITKRVKYRAPMSVRTYEWCFAMPPRCSRWTMEIRDLTRLETEERMAEVAICCPGYKMKDVACVPICPNGKTGPGCSEDCPNGWWGPNCVNKCHNCTHNHGTCSPITGECTCHEGWKGESCDMSMPTSTVRDTTEQSLTTAKYRNTQPPKTTANQDINKITEATENTSPTIINTKMVDERDYISKYPVTTETIFPTSIKPNTESSLRSPSTEKEVNNRKVETDFNSVSTIANKYEIYLQSSTTQPPESFKNNSTIRQYPTTTTTEISTYSLPKLKNRPYITQASETEVVTKLSQPTTKGKPKEIWIKPTQKGDATIVNSKTKIDLPPRLKTMNNTIDSTTPKTIIVSIIPTSIAYTTFKKISLTTASVQRESSHGTRTYSDSVKITSGGTRRNETNYSTATPPSIFTIKLLSTASTRKKASATISPLLQYSEPKLKSAFSSKPLYVSPLSSLNTTFNTTTLAPTSPVTSLNPASNTTPLARTSPGTSSNKISNKTTLASTPASTITTTLAPNSMATNNANLLSNFSSHHVLTTMISTNTTRARSQSLTTPIPTPTKPSTAKHMPTRKPKASVSRTTTQDYHATERQTTKTHQTVTVKQDRITIETEGISIEHSHKKETNVVTKASQQTNILTNITQNVTENLDLITNTITEKTTSDDNETFHILTEPEHITAVADDKINERNSADLLSILTIAGGIMMVVITIAIVVVMFERCKKPRYEAVRKVNDIRMKVIMESSDMPPPYMRSIFHTPLPDPPSTEKCHYQPISTLDRNLKQFMRPVVVQTISPVMLENFRGIIECHYDHLPRRSYVNSVVETMPTAASSMCNDHETLSPLEMSVTNATINALKCEAKFDIIDNSTSEPLYAEIPCWRPPSEYAVEVLNVNGEAVTEL